MDGETVTTGLIIVELRVGTPKVFLSNRQGVQAR